MKKTLPPYIRYTKITNRPNVSETAKISTEARNEPNNSTDDAVVLMMLSIKDSPTFLLKSKSVVGKAMRRNRRVPG